jgi:large conductance mechanosensitive channel
MFLSSKEQTIALHFQTLMAKSDSHNKGIFSRKGPADRVWATAQLTCLALSAHRIRRKRHESVISTVMGSRPDSDLVDEPERARKCSLPTSTRLCYYMRVYIEPGMFPGRVCYIQIEEEFTMRTWNNITSSSVAKRTLSIAEEFREFILRGNVVDLAVGIVIGVAFTGVVNAFVTDFINPLIPTGNNGLAGWKIPIPYSNGLLLGAFINSVISFLIIALIVFFFVVKPVNALIARFKPKDAGPATTRECPFCLSTVPIKATRCAYCTSQLPPAEQPAAAART